MYTIIVSGPLCIHTYICNCNHSHTASDQKHASDGKVVHGKQRFENKGKQTKKKAIQYPSLPSSPRPQTHSTSSSSSYHIHKMPSSSSSSSAITTTTTSWPKSSSSTISFPGFRVVVLIVLGILTLMMLINVQSGLSSVDCKVLLMKQQEEDAMNVPPPTPPSMSSVTQYAEMLTNNLLLSTTTSKNGTIINNNNLTFQEEYERQQRHELYMSQTLMFPLPRNTTTSSLAIFVLSRREAFEIRQTIRTTWAETLDNVYFVIGQPCSIPPSYRGVDEGGNSYCKVKPAVLDLSTYVQTTMEYLTQQEIIAKGLLAEQHQYQDLLMMQPITGTTSSFFHHAHHSNSMIDMYRTLPHKLKTAYHFVTYHLPDTVRYILKVDDDFYVRVPPLEERLHQLSLPESLRLPSITTTTTSSQRLPAPYEFPLVISGDIRREHKAFTNGKWREIAQFPKGAVYPTFPLGSCGHIVTRPVADFVTGHSMALLDYQGEDVSLGIWLEKASFPNPYFSLSSSPPPASTEGAGANTKDDDTTNNTKLISSKTIMTTFVDWSQYMSNKGQCRQKSFLVIGHDINKAKMKMCQKMTLANGTTNDIGGGGIRGEIAAGLGLTTTTTKKKGKEEILDLFFRRTSTTTTTGSKTAVVLPANPSREGWLSRLRGYRQSNPKINTSNTLTKYNKKVAVQ